MQHVRVVQIFQTSSSNLCEVTSLQVSLLDLSVSYICVNWYKARKREWGLCGITWLREQSQWCPREFSQDPLPEFTAHSAYWRCMSSNFNLCSMIHTLCTSSPTLFNLFSLEFFHNEHQLTVHSWVNQHGGRNATMVLEYNICWKTHFYVV